MVLQFYDYIVKTFLYLGSPRDSNPGPFAWGADALPTELAVLLIYCKMMMGGIPGAGGGGGV